MECGINNLILSILFACFVSVIIWHEKNNGIWYSPFSAISIPIVIITLLTNVFAPIINFEIVSSQVIMINSWAFLCFYIGGCIIRQNKIHPVKRRIIEIPRLKINHIHFIKFFFSVIILVAIFQLKAVLQNRSIFELEDQEYAQGGLAAHMGNFIIIILIVLIINLKYNILRIGKWMTVALIIVCLGLKLASAIKAEFLLPIICGIFISIYIGAIKLNLKNIILTVSCFVALFIGMALVFNIKEEGDTLTYSIGYFIFYLICGEVGFSEYLRYHPNLVNEQIEFVTVFFNNVINTILGTGKAHLYTDYAVTSWIQVTNRVNLLEFKTNVYSLIGEVYINTGWVIGSIFMFLLGLYSYYIRGIAKRDIFLLVNYAYLFGCLSLSFFSSSYILLPSFVYVQCACIFLSFINKTKFS